MTSRALARDRGPSRHASPRAATVAWGLAGAAVLVWVGAIWLAQHRPPQVEPLSVTDAVWGLSFLAFPAVGALIASRQPRNLVGWLFCSAPLAAGVGILGSEYVSIPSRPVVEWIGVLGAVSFMTGVATLGVFSLLFFPDGRLPSPRWRPFAQIEVGLVVVVATFDVLRTATFDEAGRVANPAHAASLTGFLDPLTGALGMLLIVGGVVGALSLIVRFRRGDVMTRRQLQVLIYVVAVAVVLLLAYIVLYALYGDSTALEALSLLMSVFAVAGVPTAIAVAIFRYRLYEIDRIVNRTVVYAVVTAVLAGSYAGLVVVLQRMLSPVTAGSDVAVAGSTLAVAAAFGPLRRRVQGFVDRRFNRRRFDAESVVASFAQRLRDEVDLDTLQADLAETVRQAVQPSALGVWVPSPGARGLAGGPLPGSPGRSRFRDGAVTVPERGRRMLGS